MAKITFTIEADTAEDLVVELGKLVHNLPAAAGSAPAGEGDTVWMPVTPGDTQEAEAERLDKRATKHVKQAEASAKADKPPKAKKEKKAKEPEPETEAEPEEVTYEQISELAQQIFSADDEGREAVLNVRKEFGLSRFSDLKVEQYAAIYARLKEIEAERKGEAA